ncbi:hypothetical protein HDV05_007445, partial [Chytridiales sp. JEL 0842]
VKLDDMDTMFVDRAIRDNAEIKLTSTVSAEGVQGFKVSSQFPFVAPVTFPIEVKEADDSTLTFVTLTVEGCAIVATRQHALRATCAYKAFLQSREESLILVI